MTFNVKILGKTQHWLPANNSKPGRLPIYNLGTESAEELVRAPVQACRDAITIVEVGKLPVDKLPKRRSATKRVSANLRKTAEHVHNDAASTRETE